MCTVRELYRFRSNFFFVVFWGLLFTMTNFVFFYFSLTDYALSTAAWYVSITAFVVTMAMSYLLHSWYDCLAKAVIKDHIPH